MAELDINKKVYKVNYIPDGDNRRHSRWCNAETREEALIKAGIAVDDIVLEVYEIDSKTGYRI